MGNVMSPIDQLVFAYKNAALDGGQAYFNGLQNLSKQTPFAKYYSPLTQTEVAGANAMFSNSALELFGSMQQQLTDSQPFRNDPPGDTSGFIWGK
jgi:hypothetical protein